jgi:pyruvate/2-oxoglutarate dehydrogenase complex dihydrolipoamide acyltransferase (E2) component
VAFAVLGIPGDILVFQKVACPDACSNLSGSFDHRVVDGADGAIFIQCIKDHLEHPATIVI